jgi:hypothetical protein
MQPKSFKPTRIVARLSVLTAVFSIACSVAQAAIVFDFTASDQGWTAAVESGSSLNEFTYSATAGLDNPKGAWFTDGVATDSIKTLTSPQMTIVANGSVTVSIVHRYNFEDGFDGGQLRYSLDGGASWTLVDRNKFSAEGYVPADAPPIDGLGSNQGWTGTSTAYLTAYITSTADLGNFNANDTLLIQFRAGWDFSDIAGAPNWEIRSVTVQNAVPEPATYAVVSGAALMAFAFWRRGRRAVGTATVPAAGTQAGERL